MRAERSGQRFAPRAFRVAALVVLALSAFAPRGSAQSRTVAYSYDTLNRLVEARYPDRLVRYTYDPAGNRLLLSVEVPNSVPVVSDIAPMAAVVGANGFTLQVTGSQFVAGAVVQWNGSARPTTFVSATSLSATIAASDLTTAGAVAVTVANPAPGGGASNAVTFTVSAVPATPAVTWSNPAPITHGTALSGTQLNATASVGGVAVDGTFAYTPPAGTVLLVGTHTLSVTFTPTDTVNYTSATKTVTIDVRTTLGGTAVPFDFDGDRKSDVLWRHATRGEVWLWPMDGTTRLSEDFVRTVSDTDWEVRGMGDQTGDGKADILWRNKTSGMIYFWPMNGSTPVSETYVATVDTTYDIVGTGDYDADGKSDILWHHATRGEVWIWPMNGTTVLSESYVDTVPDTGYQIVGTGDLNGDRKADIVWHHGTRGEVWVWLMNGTTRTSQTHIGTVPDVGYKIVAVADFDGDGKAEILWHHATRGEVWIWPMDGMTVVSETYVDTVPDTGYQIVGTGDYNGDGKAEILWHHATRGEVWVWLMNGTTKVSETWVATVPEVGYQIVKVK